MKYICIRCQCIKGTCGLHVYMVCVNFTCAVCTWSTVYVCVCHVFIDSVVICHEYICCMWVV